jgi:hypothetical protein
MNQALSLLSPRIGRFPAQPHLAQRLVLYRGELYSVPPHFRLLRVTTGVAYVTQSGQDHIVRSGQELHLTRVADLALVSGVDGEQVIVELFDVQN